MYRFSIRRNGDLLTLKINLTSLYDGLQELRIVHTGWRVQEGASPRSVSPTFLDGKTLLGMDLVRGQEIVVEITFAPARLPSANFEISYFGGGCCRQRSFINLLEYENDEGDKLEDDEGGEFEDDEGAVF